MNVNQEIKIKYRRDSAPQSLACKKMSNQRINMQAGKEYAFNFAISVLTVWRNSFAVLYGVFCKSRSFLSVKNDL
jgi:hypothetical protein